MRVSKKRTSSMIYNNYDTKRDKLLSPSSAPVRKKKKYIVVQSRYMQNIGTFVDYYCRLQQEIAHSEYKLVKKRKRRRKTSYTQQKNILMFIIRVELELGMVTL